MVTRALIGEDRTEILFFIALLFAKERLYSKAFKNNAEIKTMAKPHVNLDEVRLLHKQGAWDEARIGYLALLRINPRDPDILHALGILATQQDHLDEAIDYFEKAEQLKPEDPTIALHHANVLKMQGLFNKAWLLLEQTIQAHPEYVPAINNAGTVLFTLGKLEDAIRYFQLAIAKEPRYFDAYYNLGLAFSKKQDQTEAIATFKLLLQQVPDHYAARVLLGNCYMAQNHFQNAIEEFLRIEKTHAFHFETETNLATCYLKIGDILNAKSHYLKALELRPNDLQILFNLGFITMQQGFTDRAIQYYEMANRLNPDAFSIHNNLGVAYLAKNHLGNALHHFQEALRIEPNNETLRYTVTALQQNQRLLAAPPDYVQSLFDAYADHYDSHLLNALDYQIPTLFHKALHKLLPNTPLDILDLGCGTGLTALPFKAQAKSLTGVDLSANMLKMAVQKHHYDKLIRADILTFLQEKKAAYDLILAGDVLVYLGDLQALFTLIHTALREEGLWIFNTEITEEADFKMNQSGRFSHSKAYLEQLAQSFKVVFYKKVITRLQNNEPVYGHLYVLKRA